MNESWRISLQLIERLSFNMFCLLNSNCIEVQGQIVLLSHALSLSNPQGQSIDKLSKLSVKVPKAFQFNLLPRYNWNIVKVALNTINTKINSIYYKKKKEREKKVNTSL